MRAAQRIFCACAPGMEPVLAAELASLGLAARPVAGGAEAEGEDAAAWACLASRAADAVLLRLWEGPARDLASGKRAARRAAGRAELRVRAEGERATISVDAAGAPLFRRGWRARVGAAPLRESLAAAILLACGFGGERPFLDPMCGSGTLPVEAALVAGRRAPGLGRAFAFEDLPGGDPARVARLRAALAARARPVTVPIHASDRNAGALRLARKNAEAAGVADAIRFAREDAARAPAPTEPGLLATNPPWGVRLGRAQDQLDEAAFEGAGDRGPGARRASRQGDDAAGAWRALAALCARLPGWDLAVLGPDRGFERLLPRPLASSTPVLNGGRSCRLLRFRLG